MDVKPKSRLENLLAKISNKAGYKEINPKMKGEHYLSEIADSGSLRVLRLYCEHDDDNGHIWAYKDAERTQPYNSYEEALDAVNSADLIVARIYNKAIIPPEYTPALVCDFESCNNSVRLKEVVVSAKMYFNSEWVRYSIFLYLYEKER